MDTDPGAKKVQPADTKQDTTKNLTLDVLLDEINRGIDIDSIVKQTNDPNEQKRIINELMKKNFEQFMVYRKGEEPKINPPKDKPKDGDKPKEPPFFSKEKLKQVVENKWTGRLDTALAIALSISPTARVGFQGMKEISSIWMGDDPDKIAKLAQKTAYYGARTGLAYGTMGASELVYGLWKGIDHIVRKKNQGVDEKGTPIPDKRWNWKVMTFGVGAAAITYALAPAVASLAIDTTQNWIGAVDKLQNFGAGTDVFRPELAKAYMNVAARMSLTNLMGHTGKKMFKEDSETYEMAQRTATGLFALEAFGQNLYHSEGNILTGNREIPLTDWKPSTWLTAGAGDPFAAAGEIRDNILHGIAHPQDINLEQFNPLNNQDSDIPKGEHLQYLPNHEFSINPDGTINSDHDPLPPAREPEAYRFGENSSEPLALQKPLEIPAHTSQQHGDFDLALQNKHTQLAMYYPEQHATHLMSELEGRVPGETDTNFEIFEPDKTDVNNLQKFIHNPEWAAQTHLSYQEENDHIIKEGRLVLGNLGEDTTSASLGNENHIVIEQVEKMLNDAIESSPNHDALIPIEFNYGGHVFKFDLYPAEYRDMLSNGENAGERIFKALDGLIETNGYNINSNFIDKIQFKDHPDFNTTFKAALAEQIAEKLGISDFGDTNNSYGEKISDFNSDHKVTFYEELSARLHHQSPEAAQALFESRINPDVEPTQYPLGQAEQITTAGEERVGIILNGQMEEIPRSELNAIYNLATDHEHGLLNASNSYLGSRGITTSIQLSDGTILGFGSEQHKSDLVPGQEEHFVTDNFNSSSHSGTKGLEDDLRIELKEINPNATDEQIDKMVVEASVKLAQVAETHNYGKYLEELLTSNPGQKIHIVADGETVLEDFYLEYNKADDSYNVFASNNALIGYLSASNFTDADLLIEKLSSDKFGLFAHNLQGLAIDPNATFYHTNSEYLEKSIMERFEEVLKANSTPTPPEPINMIPYHAVNGDPHGFYNNLKTYEQDHGVKILGTIIGNELQTQLGQISTLNQEVINRPEYPELTVVMDDTPPATAEQLSHAADIGSILYYNPAQLLVLNNMQSNFIENASREIGQYYLSHPSELNVHPLVVTLPLTQGGYTADFDIQFNGGPINFEALYTQVASHINNHVDSETGQITDPYNPAFQAYVNHLIINNMVPELTDRDIELEYIIDSKNYYYSVGDDHKLTIPISQLLTNSSGNISQDMMSLSMQRVVGDPALLSPETGLPALVPISVSPAAFVANTPITPIDPAQSLPPATAPLLPTLYNSLTNGISNGISGINSGLTNTRLSILEWFLYLTGNPTTLRAIDGSEKFLGAVVEHGTPLARHAAEVAASYPTEYALDAGDIAYTAKTNVLDKITLFGYRPFTMADNMLARPLNSLAELQYANRNIASYGIDDLFNNVIDDVRTPGLYGYGDRGVTDANAFNDWWNKAENFYNGLDSDIRNNLPNNYNLINPGLYDTYTVQRGDSLSAIAGRIWGNPNLWPKLYEANKDIVENPRLIYRGEILRIPNINN